MPANSLSFPRQVRQLATDIGQRYLWRIPVLVLLMTVVALSEGIRMNLLHARWSFISNLKLGAMTNQIAQ